MFKTERLYYHPVNGAARVVIGQHFMVNGRKGHAVNLGTKYVEVAIYAGPRVKVDPLTNRPLDTHHA